MSGSRILCLASIGLAAALLAGSAMAVPFDLAEGWREIAHFDGAVPVSQATYVNGLGSFGDSNFAELASSYDYLGADFTVGIVMGDFTDFFRPISDSLLLADMLSSQSNHLWSDSFDGPYVQPVYFSSHLGGSAAGWPADGRLFLTFWGSDGQLGGGVQSVLGGPVQWGQPLTMYAMVPESTTIVLANLGLMMLGVGGRQRGPH